MTSHGVGSTSALDDPVPGGPTGPAEPAAAEGAPARGGVGRKAVSGIAWLTADVAIAKIGGTLLNLVLAYLLAPDEIGLFALALSVVSIAEFASRSGLRDILIKRADEYESLGGTALWLSLGLGLVSAAVIVAIAGPAAGVLEAPRVEPLLRLAALTPIVNCLAIVPRARLESCFRFKAITLIHWGVVAVKIAVSIGLAAAGMGAAALVWGLVVSTAAGMVAMWALAGAPPSLGWAGATARGMLGDMSSLFVAGILTALVAQGDYFLLGKFADEAEVGLYYMAFAFSIQVVLIFAMNLNRVMMPALSSLASDPDRQRRAFVEAARALMLIGGPVCLLQAALSEPLIELLLPDAYAGAAMPMAVLLLGMYFRLLSFAAVPLIKSQGRFKTLLVCQTLSAIWILGPAAVGSWLAGATGCAAGVAIGSMLNGLVVTSVGLNDGLRGLRTVVSIQTPPLVVCVLAAAAAWAVGLPMPEGPGWAAAWLAAGGLVGGLIVLAGARVFLPARLAESLRRTQVLWTRLPLARDVARALMPGRQPRGAP